MSGETTISIVGNLTADPELRFTGDGTPWARFTIASTPLRFDRDTGAFRDGDTLFMRCVAWRQLAEHITESLHKGTRVVVTGRLRQSTWETDGQKRSAIDLDIEEIGPSLRFATASVRRPQRTTVTATLADDDPWGHPPTPNPAPAATAQAAPMAAAAATAPQSVSATSAGNGNGGDAPPY
jgi:single-strand DNA-binding protein